MNMDLVAMLKALTKAQAAKHLRLAHGYTCVWPDGEDDVESDPLDYADDFPLGEIHRGYYAIGFEPYYVTQVWDAVEEVYEAVIFESREEALEAYEAGEDAK